MGSRDDLIAVFEDTEKWYRTDADLKEAIKASIQGTKIYMEGDTFYDTPDLLTHRDARAKVLVSKHKTLEAALLIRHKYTEAKIAIHNFASATNPGGGVKKGSRAQEECLCRTTTLYPVLDTDTNWKRYYKFHRARHLLSVAALNGADILILGAFGCGAFQNKPEVVAKAYASVLPDFLRQFQVIEFAVYCTPHDMRNYVAFYNTLSKLGR